MNAPQATSDWIGHINQALKDLPLYMHQVDWRVAVVLVPLGLASMFYGFKLFKAIITLYSAVVGAAVGWWVTAVWLHEPSFWWAGALVGGALFALVAWPLVNFFVGFWGAMAGGLLGYGLAKATGDPTIIWIGVIVGVVVCAVLAILLLRLMIIVTTSVVGAYMLVIGSVVLLSLVGGFKKPIDETLQSKHYILPVVVFLPALVGMIVQLYQSEPAKKGPEKKEEAEE